MNLDAWALAAPIGFFRRTLSGALALAACALAGCAVGPNYHRPAALGTNTLPPAFAEATNSRAGDWKIAEPSTHRARGVWWETFGDAELNRVETLATAHNQELALLLARFNQARALVDIARADFFPHLNAGPGVTRQRTSANDFDRGKEAGVSQTYSAFRVPLDSSWELDLWGRVRRQVEAARAQLAAASDDLAAARLVLQAEVATDYFTLRALDGEFALLQQTIETYRRSLELTRNRRQGGIAGDLDVAQAETQLKTTEAQLPVVDLQRTKLRHALATLCGQSAGTFALASAGGLGTAQPTVPVSLPSELLERRPDLAAAERRMAAANAQVGIARTAFYPRVVFNGLGGFQSIHAGTLFDWPSRFWAVGPSLDLPLFTGGRNRAQLRAARSDYDGAVAAYRQTVLTAFQEVEDQLAAQRLLATELEAENAALGSARRTLEIANNRYKAGLVTYLEVATAQSTALAHERTVVQLSAERLAASVALIKALGGGWDARIAPSFSTSAR